MTRIVRIMLMQLLTRAVGFTWVQQLTWAVHWWQLLTRIVGKSKLQVLAVAGPSAALLRPPHPGQFLRVSLLFFWQRHVLR